MATKKQDEAITVLELTMGTVDIWVLGRTPIILNRMWEKVLHELLMPHKKTTAEKQSTLKHDPYMEFRKSAYTLPDDGAPTFLAHLAVAFKKAMAGAALDIPGAKKAQIGRLVQATGERIPIYGVPKLFMAVTRSADINHTPDVRTRCIVPEWAAKITFTYATPILKLQGISNLLGAAGFIQGVGDWRPEKGSGTYGQFEIVAPTDERLKRIIKDGGRKAQKAALEHPEPYDEESAEMLAWFTAEAKARGFKVDAA